MQIPRSGRLRTGPIRRDALEAGEAWEPFMHGRGGVCVVTAVPVSSLCSASLWRSTCLNRSRCVQLARMFHLGVGDAGLIPKREHYEEIVSTNVHSPNHEDTAGRLRSRSFVIPRHLTVEGNRLVNLVGEYQCQTVNIPATVVAIVNCSRNV